MSGPRIKLCIAFFWIAPISFFAYLSFVHPWQAALDALATFERGPRIVTAVSYQGGLIDASAPIHRTQVYLVLPDSLRSLNAYQVIQDDRGVRVETVHFGLLGPVDIRC